MLIPPPSETVIFSLNKQSEMDPSALTITIAPPPHGSDWLFMKVQLFMVELLLQDRPCIAPPQAPVLSSKRQSCKSILAPPYRYIPPPPSS